ncbi:hypothetical protein HWC44_gp094 [Mycobacterium phage ThetaBob]|uniref:Uncharacterized protein n=1 Tax=Mycobacterium phage ThetaBob TaxID=2588513 RepID=A0A4Y6EQJ2_9CAUD|nr:hypothetical protein HWC44_gp094 [Mycobacterium phage ThetaBob]QDF19981.1 hypothetical protein SEA_THETABOB_94 [Mycobacterium phage ThetaBob]
MSDLLAAAFVVVAILLLVVWIGPHIALWSLNRVIARYNRIITNHNRRQRENRRRLAEACDELLRYRRQQNGHVGSVVQSEPNQEGITDV